MNDQFSMFDLPNFLPIPNATSSPASVDGPSPCALQDGLTTGPPGPDHRPASLSAQQGKARAVTMQDTSPPSLSAWSGLPAPECCLANRSQARMCSERLQSALEETLSRRLNGLGSTIYQIVWKPHVTPLGRAISRLRASAPRTSAKEPSSEPSAMSGWPSPTVGNATGSQMAKDASPTGRRPDGSKATVSLPQVASFAGWPTTQASDGSGGGQMKRALNPARSNDLMDFAQLAGWPTPVANDDNKTPEAHLAMKKRMGERDGSNSDRTAITSLQVMAKFTQPARLTASGQMLTGSCAGMESGGQLNPDLSRWLMGYPAAWGSCGATAMQSIRTRRRSSSKRSAKASK